MKNVRHTQKLTESSVNLGEIRRKFDETRAQFILSELSLAITFCEIATSTRDSERAERNQRNARQAFESAMRYLAHASVTTQEGEQISEKMGKLRGLLAKIENAVPGSEAQDGIQRQDAAWPRATER
jgi:hypothetical protein